MGSYAVIVPIAGGSTSDSGFQYVLRKDTSDASGDTWIRENLDSPDDTTPDYQYTLVRVINGDGTPNARWWPEFLDYAAEHGIDRADVGKRQSMHAFLRDCEFLLFLQMVVRSAIRACHSSSACKNEVFSGFASHSDVSCS